LVDALGVPPPGIWLRPPAKPIWTSRRGYRSERVCAAQKYLRHGDIQTTTVYETGPLVAGRSKGIHNLEILTFQAYLMQNGSGAGQSKADLRVCCGWERRPRPAQVVCGRENINAR